MTGLGGSSTFKLVSTNGDDPQTAKMQSSGCDICWYHLIRSFRSAKWGSNEGKSRQPPALYRSCLRPSVPPPPSPRPPICNLMWYVSREADTHFLWALPPAHPTPIVFWSREWDTKPPYLHPQTFRSHIGNPLYFHPCAHATGYTYVVFIVHLLWLELKEVCMIWQGEYHVNFIRLRVMGRSEVPRKQGYRC